MTDHRVTDLSYGHLGEASYNIDLNQWGFSIDPERDQNLQEVLNLRVCIPPSIQHIPDSMRSSSNIARSQVKWLVKSRPEIFPANVIASSLSQEPSEVHHELRPSVGQLLALGEAGAVDETRGSRTVSVIAMPCGEAGHVLRLIRPRIERRGWGRRSAARVSLMDPESSDQGYWVGIGGTILQTAFAQDGNLSSTWLAVRQAAVTTIFRPVYGTKPVSPVVPRGYTKEYPPSRLNANPVAVLAAERSGSLGHADISFNPWYSRQFAVIDQFGSWSIWDIEGKRTRSSGIELIPGKSGRIYDGYAPDPRLKKPGNADGWHQVLWVGNLSTIFLCNRRHIAVFDVKATPTRLQSTELLAASNSDWILDVKQSPVHLSHLFVLTSSRIFWLEVTPAGEDKDGDAGARVIVSYRHFRDPSDETMRLSTVKDEDVTVVISSGTSSLVNFYTFSIGSDGAGGITSGQGSLRLSTIPSHPEIGIPGQLQTLYFVQAPMTTIPTRFLRPELQHIEHTIKFYQVFALTTDLALSTALCAMSNASSSQDSQIPKLGIIAPATKSTQTSRYAGSQLLEKSTFIVPDGSVDAEGSNSLPQRVSHDEERSVVRRQKQNDLRLRINWRGIFKLTFMGISRIDPQQIESSGSFWVAELLENVADRIHQGKEKSHLAISTLLELSQASGLSEDLEEAAPILREFLESLQEDEDPDAPLALILSDLTSCPGINFTTAQDSKLPNLLKVYDQVAEQWMVSLPKKVSNLARLSKFKIARKLAVELCLSSIAVSLRNISHGAFARVPDSHALHALFNRATEISLEGSPALLSSQVASNPLQEASFSLPTPARTPSLYSHNSTTESSDDPAIVRLRQYAVSIKSHSDLGNPTLLSQWPSNPGVDPVQYSRGGMNKTRAADEGGEESDHRKQPEEPRRRRRTEKILNRERIVASGTASQSSSLPIRSQPDVSRPPASSQMVGDERITQPNRVDFGSRFTQQVKNKPKKRRAAGF